MAEHRRNCSKGHRFAEHGIGAGLTRKVCKDCGVVKIGESRRFVISEVQWEHPLDGIFASAS